MDIIINFPNVLNVSVQIGDIAYFTPTTSVGNFDTSTNLQGIGPVIDVGDTWIKCTVVGTQPTQGDFIMFAKDRRANMSSLLGYYAKFKFINNSQDESEIFAVGLDILESSK